MSRALEELLQREDRLNLGRRLGQALWMYAAAPLEPTGLVWARGLLGPQGDTLLWRVLTEEGVVSRGSSKVDPAALSNFLGTLLGAPPASEPRVVWSAPAAISQKLRLQSYLATAVDLVASAQSSVFLVSPFLEPGGVAHLMQPVLDSIQRGVAVRLITHEALTISSINAQSLEELRKESVARNGNLMVYSAISSGGALLHSKIVLVDRESVLIGSANITTRGLGENLEAGVVLRGRTAAEVASVLDALVESELVSLTFSTRR